MSPGAKLWGNCNIQFISKRCLDKLSTHSITPGSTLHLLTFLIFPRIKLNPRWSIAAISGLELLNCHFSILLVFKIIFIILWGKDYSPFCSLFSSDTTLDTYCYSITCSCPLKKERNGRNIFIIFCTVGIMFYCKYDLVTVENTSFKRKNLWCPLYFWCHQHALILFNVYLPRFL